MTTLKRIFLLLALGACLAAAGCGSDGEKGAPIPAEQAQSLEVRLAETENRLADGSVGACEDILQDGRPGVQQILASLPDSVDPDVRDALEQSFENLWRLVDSECVDRKPDEPAQTTPTETEPEVTETETTPTQPTETETTPTSPDEAPLPPEGDGNNGGGIPGEGGGGGGFGPGGAKAKKEKQ